ncbi:MAG: ACP S-malonyltransferase [Phycisphaerae bacterium]|nr:ACP S-malonyltransferase [Phycisphaerae bacterium]
MRTAFLFPGQGAQTVGMAKDVAQAIPQAAAVYEKAGRILGLDLAKLCFEGPAEQLNTTAMSQPAIFTTSVALLEALKAGPGGQGIRPDVCAGLSLGEYTALHAAGVIGFEEALRLVWTRGRAMQAAADATPGAMVSIIGLDPEKARALCDQAAQGESLQPANYNCPGQIVISGTRAACERAEALAPALGAAKAVRLEVAGAFHTPLMAPAAAALEQALAGCPLRDPSPVRVLSNATADYYADGRSVPAGLVRQLTSPVLWQGCMERLLADGVERFVEIGPGKVLTSLMRRIHRRADITPIHDLASLEGAKF